MAVRPAAAVASMTASISSPGEPARFGGILSFRRHGGGAGSRKAGPYVLMSASRLPTRGDILAPVRSLIEPGAPMYLPAQPWLESRSISAPPAAFPAKPPAEA
jgi:hypothetical protein